MNVDLPVVTTSGLSALNDLRRRLVVVAGGCESDDCPVGVFGHDGGDYKDTCMRDTSKTGIR